MKLYLVQHGESKQEAEDPARPLTDAGRKSMEQVGRRLARTALFQSGLAVRHSGKLRAKQTAEILASLLGVPGPPQEVGGLAPNDPPELALELVQRSASDLLLVGHLPHLSRLASLLVGAAERTVVRFRMGGVVCLGRDESGAWALEWMLVPELAGPQAG